MSLADNRPLTPEEVTRQLREAIDELNRSPLSRGRLLDTDTTPGAVAGKGISFVAGAPRSFPHKLGRRAHGFLEVYGASVSSAAHVGLFRTTAPSGLTSETHITVTPSASGTCFIWVF